MGVELVVVANGEVKIPLDLAVYSYRTINQVEQNGLIEEPVGFIFAINSQRVDSSRVSCESHLSGDRGPNLSRYWRGSGEQRLLENQFPTNRHVQSNALQLAQRHKN